MSEIHLRKCLQQIGVAKNEFQTRERERGVGWNLDDQFSRQIEECDKLKQRGSFYKANMIVVEVIGYSLPLTLVVLRHF